MFDLRAFYHTRIIYFPVHIQMCIFCMYARFAFITIILAALKIDLPPEKYLMKAFYQTMNRNGTENHIIMEWLILFLMYLRMRKLCATETSVWMCRFLSVKIQW